MCGGTAGIAPAADAIDGLSPRVRGNRCSCPAPPAWPGSIPACAGEPLVGFQLPTGRPVYPRVCGGTTIYPGRRTFALGLSPRVRGNLPGSLASGGGPRSIPACAGEPIVPTLAHVRFEVYPRVCGGTGNATFPRYPLTGVGKG